MRKKDNMCPPPFRFPRIQYQHEAHLGDFLRQPLVITEKLDGLNICLYNGQVYGGKDLSSEPLNAPYVAMVKKHHAWKTSNEQELYFYGEDLYAQHSCKYTPIRESETFRVFMIMTVDKYALSWNETRAITKRLGLKCVPVLHRGVFYRNSKLNEVIDMLKGKPSAIGGEREGVVVRVQHAFKYRSESIFKSVRDNHVQPDAEHWRKNWKPREVVYDNSWD